MQHVQLCCLRYTAVQSPFSRQLQVTELSRASAVTSSYALSSYCCFLHQMHTSCHYYLCAFHNTVSLFYSLFYYSSFCSCLFRYSFLFLLVLFLLVPLFLPVLACSVFPCSVFLPVLACLFLLVPLFLALFLLSYCS